MTQSRRQRQRQETKEEILQIAREEMQEKGVAALSLGEIARRMGMKTPSLYNYFESKDAIYDELFRRGYEQYTCILEGERHRSGPVAERLAQVLDDYMRFAQENPDLYQIMFQRPVPGFVPSEESYAVSLNMLAVGRAEIKAILDSGELDFDLPVEKAMDLVIALMHGLTEMHLANNPELPVGEGRYGKLGPAAVDFVLAAWGTGQQ
jgi:AcrR family transcriptional regulator